MNALRRLLYAWARALGDVNAYQRGPSAVGRRHARKIAGRTFGRLTRWPR